MCAGIHSQSSCHIGRGNWIISQGKNFRLNRLIRHKLPPSTIGLNLVGKLPIAIIIAMLLQGRQPRLFNELEQA